VNPRPSASHDLHPHPQHQSRTFAIGNEHVAKHVVDLLNEIFLEGQAAIAAFERPTGAGTFPCILPSRPDQTQVRELIRFAAGGDVAQDIAVRYRASQRLGQATLEELVPGARGPLHRARPA